jgi:hypothetical protein
MHRFWRTALGILTTLPLLSVLLLLLYFEFHPAALEAITSAGDISPTIYSGPGWGLQAAALGMLMGLTLYVFYLVWTVRTSKLTAKEKAVWVVLLSVVGALAMPVLWWRHFRAQRQQ